MKHINHNCSDDLLNSIFDLIKQGDEEIKIDDSNFVIVCGDTGSGKSTLINYLSGGKLRAFKPNNSRKLCIDTVDPNSVAKIGHTKNSETLVPNRVEDNMNNIIYWDCPGFDDSRGSAVDIANAFYINKLFTSDRIKILMVIDESSLNGPKRGQSFKELVFRLSELFVNKDEFVSCTSIVFTKSRDIDNYRKELQTFLNETQDSLEEEEKKLLEKIIDEVPISRFDVPLQTGEICADQSAVIIDEMQKSNYISCPNVRITVSINSLIAVQQLIKFTSKQISKIVKNIANKLDPLISESMGLDTVKQIEDYCKKLLNTTTASEVVPQIEEIARLISDKSSTSILDDLQENIDEIKSLVHHFENFYNKIIPSTDLEASKLKDPFGLKIMHKLEVVTNYIVHKENQELLTKAMKEAEEKHEVYKKVLDEKEEQFNQIMECKEQQMQLIAQQLEQEKQGRINFEQLLSQQENLVNNLNDKILELEKGGGNTELLESLSKQMLELTNKIIDIENRPVEVHHHNNYYDDGGGGCVVM